MTLIQTGFQPHFDSRRVRDHAGTHSSVNMTILVMLRFIVKTPVTTRNYVGATSTVYLQPFLIDFSQQRTENNPTCKCCSSWVLFGMHHHYSLIASLVCFC